MMGSRGPHRPQVAGPLPGSKAAPAWVSAAHDGRANTCAGCFLLLSGIGRRAPPRHGPLCIRWLTSRAGLMVIDLSPQLSGGIVKSCGSLVLHDHAAAS